MKILNSVFRSTAPQTPSSRSQLHPCNNALLGRPLLRLTQITAREGIRKLMQLQTVQVRSGLDARTMLKLLGAAIPPLRGAGCILWRF
jgi:hypothetical protein